MKTICVVYNARSGRKNDLAELKDAFKSRRLEADFINLQANVAAKVQAMTSSKDTVVVAAGGDGTVCAVAALVVGSKASFGVIPRGTLNHFAKDLGIPEALDDAIEVIADGHTKAVDAVKINDRIFLNNSSIGIYTTLVRLRERHEQKWGKWVAALGVLPIALRQRRNYTVTLKVDKIAVTRTTPFIFVGNNSYDIDQFGIANRSLINEGQLCIYLLTACTTWQIIGVVLRLVLGKSDSAEAFEAFIATEFKVEFKRKTIDVACDGEVHKMSTPLHYASLPKVLEVLVPKAANSSKPLLKLG